MAIAELLHRRAILVYLMAIVAPALALLYFGVESFQRQREAVATLLESNLHLSAKNFSADIERNTRELAQACLRDAEFAAPESAAFESVRRKHPIVRYLFLMEAGRVVYPPVHTAPPRSLDEVLAREEPKLREEYAQAFRAAEIQELRQERLDSALAGYRRAGQLRVSNELKALALHRVGRCLQKMNRRIEASRVYAVLAERYGTLTDLSHRPYALVATLATEQPPATKDHLRNDLLRGRWPLSADQADYFLSQLGGRTDSNATDYVSHLQFARAIEEQFRHAGATHPDEVYAYAFTARGEHYQIFYRPLDDGTAGRLLGFAVDTNWVETRLLPVRRAALKIAEEARLVAKGDPPALGSEVRAEFASMFPFWELAITAPSASPGLGGLLAHAAITGLVLCLLLMGILLLLRDVSRERRLNQLRADFVGAASHELKTPITLIRLYAETLLEDEDFLPAQRRDFYQIIARESDRLTQLIEKVLAFSRVARGEQQYVLQRGDLAPVVSRTIEVYQQYLKRHGFSVATQLAGGLPPVRFDADAVCQALVNLLDNAAKYSSETKAVAVRSYASNGAVVLEVEDRGIGIPPEEQPKIFQQFYRVPNGGAKGGYGLGLYLIRHIMDAHDGRVEVESQPGRGSIFRLLFPLLSIGTPS